MSRPRPVPRQSFATDARLLERQAARWRWIARESTPKGARVALQIASTYDAQAARAQRGHCVTAGSSVQPPQECS